MLVVSSLIKTQTGTHAYLFILYHALRNSQLREDCRRTIKCRVRFARVNCKKIQFKGEILPGTDCGDESHGKFAPHHHSEGSNDRRRNDRWDVAAAAH